MLRRRAQTPPQGSACPCCIGDSSQGHAAAAWALWVLCPVQWGPSAAVSPHSSSVERECRAVPAPGPAGCLPLPIRTAAECCCGGVSCAAAGAWLRTELSDTELSVLDKNRHQPLRAAASPRCELHALRRAEQALLLRSLQGAEPQEAVLQGECCVSADGAPLQLPVWLNCCIPAALTPPGCSTSYSRAAGSRAVPALTVLSPQCMRALPCTGCSSSGCTLGEAGAAPELRAGLGTERCQPQEHWHVTY